MIPIAQLFHWYRSPHAREQQIIYRFKTIISKAETVSKTSKQHSFETLILRRVLRHKNSHFSPF
jgi:ribosomal protein S21